MAWINRPNCRRGTMLVEAAIILLLLLTLTFGVLEYGWLFIKSEEIANAARHGARVGARIDATNEDVQTAVASLMSRAGISHPTVTIEPDVSTLDLGQTLTVTVQVPYKRGSEVEGALELLDAPFLPVPAQLQFSVSMAKEGT